MEKEEGRINQIPLPFSEGAQAGGREAWTRVRKFLLEWVGVILSKNDWKGHELCLRLHSGKQFAVVLKCIKKYLILLPLSDRVSFLSF